jgi:hypothetical protein
LDNYYKRWYPKSNGYKKIVPPDIQITPMVLLHWFMDDGSSYIRIRKDYKQNWQHKIRQIKITMSCESFSKEDQELLSKKIRDRFHLNFSTHRCNSGTGWRLVLSQPHVPLFYDIIGVCPVPSLQYKWK